MRCLLHLRMLKDLHDEQHLPTIQAILPGPHQLLKIVPSHHVFIPLLISIRIQQSLQLLSCSIVSLLSFLVLISWGAQVIVFWAQRPILPCQGWSLGSRGRRAQISLSYYRCGLG